MYTHKSGLSGVKEVEGVAEAGDLRGAREVAPRESSHGG